MCKKRGLMTASLCICAVMLGSAQYANAARERPGWSKYAATNADKVIICHKADSVKYFPISVSARAIPAHLGHGDCLVDDGIDCTVDSCDEAVGCIHAPDNAACDDGDACTIDTCDPATGCVYTPVNCDDGNACTNDSCNPASGCEYAVNEVCGDGVVCGLEQCECVTDCPAGNTCVDCQCIPAPNPECAGATCATFVPCNPDSGCPSPVCGTTTEDGGLCVEGTTGCDGLADCVTSADCGPGGFCLKDTCCVRNVCITPAAFCNPPSDDDCFKGEVCDIPQACTTADGCDGACFHTAQGPTKCFFGEYSCDEYTTPCCEDSDCAAGEACANSCCGATCVPLCEAPPPVDECFKEAACAGAQVCTDAGGCTGACFFTAAGVTKCFESEFTCGTYPACTTDADCAPGFGCSDTCCGLECAPLCGGSAAAVEGSSSKAPTAAAAVQPGPSLGSTKVQAPAPAPAATGGSSSN